MWESVDGSEWVIYYFNARAVVMVTDNFDAMQEAGMDVSAETSIECTLAFFAMPPTSSHVRGCGCRGRQTEEEVGGAWTQHRVSDAHPLPFSGNRDNQRNQPITDS